VKKKEKDTMKLGNGTEYFPVHLPHNSCDFSHFQYIVTSDHFCWLCH